MTEQIRSKSEDFVSDGTIYSFEYILARAAGELHGEAVRRYLKDFDEAKGNTAHHIQLTFDRLMHVGAMSKSEVLRLKTILTLLDEHTASSADALKVVRDVHNALVDEEASPCAVALASIAENSITLAIEMVSAKGKVNWWHALGADLVGAGAGALTGAPVAGVGAVGGAIAGAASGTGAYLAAAS
jgi:hypothetical protein